MSETAPALPSSAARLARSGDPDRLLVEDRGPRSGRGDGRRELRAREVEDNPEPGGRPNSPRCDTLDVSRSRLVLLAVAVTLLLAVVAIAARGRPLGSGLAAHGGLPGSVLGLPGPPRSSSSPCRSWSPGWWEPWSFRLPPARSRVLSGRACSVCSSSMPSSPRSSCSSCDTCHFHPQQPQSTRPPTRGTASLKPGQRTHQHGSGGNRQVRFQWDEFAVVLGLLLVLAVGAFIALGRSRVRKGTPDETAAEALAAALDESLDDLRTEPDLRRAIIAAYARMERALAAAGTPAPPCRGAARVRRTGAPLARHERRRRPPAHRPLRMG